MRFLIPSLFFFFGLSIFFIILIYSSSSLYYHSIIFVLLLSIFLYIILNLFFIPIIIITNIPLPLTFPSFQLVFMDPLHTHHLCVHIRLHHDDTTNLHQLQNEISCPLAMEATHIQVSQHHHRRSICLYYQNAHTTSIGVFP